MIVLLRHGRTEANARRLLVGRADPPLDPEGRHQAELAAKAVAEAARDGDGDVAQVVSSPLRRCRETAAVVAAALGAEVVVDERWVELDYGEMDGTPIAAVPAETWARWQADITWAPPGGESLAELGKRVRSACGDLSRSAVVVSHVSPIKAAVAWALGVGDEIAWRMWVAPASITRIGIAAGRPALRSFNELAHLDG